MKDDFKPFRPEPAFVPIVIEPGQPELDVDSSPETSNFITPEAAAKQDESTQEKHTEMPQQEPAEQPSKPDWKKRLDPRNWTMQQRIIAGVIAAVVILGGGTAIWWLVTRNTPAPVVVENTEEEPAPPTTVASRLTGVQVEPKLNDLPTTGVMIENSPDARPQAGLYDAGVVFEAIAEGGITRFLALYQESSPEHIGPIRSVRPYYLDFLAPFDAPIAHAGGSAQALAELRSQGFKDLEAFQNPNFYERVRNRYAPHNLYTGRSRMLELQKHKGWSKSTFTGFARKSEEKPSSAPTAKSISVNISSFLYNPQFDYNPTTNSYLRKLAGRPHTDEKTGKQIHPKSVVVLVMRHHYAGIYSVYGVTGSGRAYVFQDGDVTIGTWTKKSRKSQFTFTTTDNKTLELNPGQTWISVVGNADAVSYKP